MESVVVDARCQPGERVGDQVVRDERAEDRQHHEYDRSGPCPEFLPDERIDDGDENEKIAGSV
jgi:hypothetical protein